MNFDLAQLIHHSICGGLAAAGFGVLFNISPRGLPSCAGAGAIALATRTILLQWGWKLEPSSFVAALVLGLAVQLWPVSRFGVSRGALHVAGCIPMVPGSFAAKAILGLFSITAVPPVAAGPMLTTSLAYAVRVAFTIGALGTGMAVPSLLLRHRRDPAS